MANTQSRDRGRNGGGEQRRDEESWRRSYDEDEARTRGRFATHRSGYSDREEDAGGYGYQGRGTGDWQEYAPGGSWYGREDFGAPQERDEYRGSGRQRQGGEFADAMGFENEDRQPRRRGGGWTEDRGSSRDGSRFGGGQQETGFGDEASWTSGPYAGKGPKGYRRSNEQITEEASQRLYRHGQVDASDIDVICEDGVLVLKGTVFDRRMKRLAEDCVESVFGVDDVVNELRVRKPSQERNEPGDVAGRQARQSR